MRHLYLEKTYMIMNKTFATFYNPPSWNQV